MTDLSKNDLKHLEERGVARDDAERQLRLLRQEQRYTRVARACSLDDGIEVLEEEKQAFLKRIYESHEFSRAVFVPASGAATRMFRDLLQWRAGGTGERRGLEQAVSKLHDQRDFLPFDLPQAVSSADALVDELVGPEGQDLASLPKALLPFHQYGEGARTAFAEHLVEGSTYLKADGVSRFHFTVSGAHRARFEAELEAVRESLEARQRTRLDVAFSEQCGATDTLCLDDAGALVRTPSGLPMLRPGGHGSLLRNLAAIDADVVFVKNIDNVMAEVLHDDSSRWKKVLGGYLVWLRQRVHDLLVQLQEDPTAEAVREASVFVERQLGVVSTHGCGGLDAAGWLCSRLDRPLRVCGVVPNDGQPGGGPFWVQADDGVVGRQIVESAQVQLEDDAQARIFHSATHFNPVDMVCSLRDPSGRPYDLDAFVDESAVVIAQKTVEGRSIRALEWPGLWNGAMAGWNTVFVELPREVFAPVKTVFDLLLPPHQPGASRRSMATG